jgi:hypothetical protein
MAMTTVTLAAAANSPAEQRFLVGDREEVASAESRATPP